MAKLIEKYLAEVDVALWDRCKITLPKSREMKETFEDSEMSSLIFSDAKLPEVAAIIKALQTQKKKEQQKLQKQQQQQ